MPQPYTPERDDEQVTFEQRLHWIALAPLGVTLFGMTIAVVAAEYLLGRYADQIAPVVPLSVLQLAVAVVIGLCLLIAGIGWWVYRQNRLILTNFHVVQITQTGLFNRKISQLSLSEIQDVTTHQKGILANILGFGDVMVETAGARENFIFHQLPVPYDLCDRILHAHDTMGVPPPPGGGV